MPLFNLNTGYLSSVSKTTTYTATPAEDIVYCDATSAAWTLTVPSAASNPKKIFCFKKTDSSFNAITISGTGMTTNYLMTEGETVVFQSDGSNWIQIYRKTDTPWASFSGSGTWSTNTTYTQAKWRRGGDGVEIYYEISLSGAPTAADLHVNIPNSSGWTIDTAKLTATAIGDCYGQVSLYDSGTDNFTGRVGYNNTTSLAILADVLTGAYIARRSVSNLTPYTFANSDKIIIRTFSIPITNFSA